MDHRISILTSLHLSCGISQDFFCLQGQECGWVFEGTGKCANNTMSLMFHWCNSQMQDSSNPWFNFKKKLLDFHIPLLSDRYKKNHVFLISDKRMVINLLFKTFQYFSSSQILLVSLRFWCNRRNFLFFSNKT